MTWQDLVNGSYESLAAFAVLNHCRVLYNAKKSEGVSILSVIFFWTWGIWNVYYYPHLNQWISFLGGCMIVLANGLYVYLLIKYKFFQRGQ